MRQGRNSGIQRNRWAGHSKRITLPTDAKSMIGLYSKNALRAAEAAEMDIEEFNKSYLGSVFSYQPAQLPKKIENTYRLGPKHKILESDILKVISFAQKTVLTDLNKVDQPLLKTRSLLLKLLDLVRLQLKTETKLNRYKTIVTGFVGK